MKNRHVSGPTRSSERKLKNYKTEKASVSCPAFAMSVFIHTRGEAGGGVAAHLKCPQCGQLSKSHANMLSHLAGSHPSCLDDVTVGRLGNILIYQSTANLFHCSICFYTCRDFNKLYKHIISKHCVDNRDGGGGEVGEGDEEEKMGDEGDEENIQKTKGEGEDVEREKMEEGGGVEGRKAKEGEGGENKIKGEEEAEDTETKALDGKRSSDAKEEGEKKDVDDTTKSAESDKPEGEEVESLMFDGSIHRCLICGWKNKLKALGVNHVMKKHDIPKAYASQAIKRDTLTVKQTLSGSMEDEETGMTGELLREEMKAMAKVVNFNSNRFECLICGWKTKLKGFAISHVMRNHEVERPYQCKDCATCFFLPSRLHQHVRTTHRPGRYACPFCCFRSHYLGGFRRHCSRCNAREEGDVGGVAGMGEYEGEEEEEGEEGRKETRAERKRRRSRAAIEGDDDEKV